MLPVIYQDPTTKTMYCTDGLRTVASPVARSYQWYFDDVLQPSLTTNSFIPTFSDAGVAVRCEVTIGASAVSSAPVVVTDWLRQMPAGAYLLFDASFPGPAAGLEGPFESGGLYAMAGWTNQGNSGYDAVAGTNAPLLAWGGDTFGTFAGLQYVSLNATQWFTLQFDAGLGPKRTDFWVMHQASSGTRRILQPPSNQLVGASSSILAYYNNSAYRELEGAPTLPRTFALTIHVDTQINGYFGRTLSSNSPQPYVDETVVAGTGGMFATAAGTSNWGGRCYFGASYDRALSPAELNQAWDYLESRFPMLF